MRGTLLVYRGDPSGAGIIPADAGNTLPTCRKLILPGDYPRGCGEHRLAGQYVWILMGSSPRMRGTLLPCSGCGYANGIIPADAGNTLIPGSHMFMLEDHPRGCGEHSAITPEAKANQGSSPRMRGTLRQ